MARPAAHNTYFAAVKQNPVDARGRTLLGLFPTVLSGSGGGGDSPGGGVGGAGDAGSAAGIIGLSISCDGVYWAPLVRLRPTQSTDNRTWDQPVDGFELAGGTSSSSSWSSGGRRHPSGKQPNSVEEEEAGRFGGGGRAALRGSTGADAVLIFTAPAYRTRSF